MKIIDHAIIQGSLSLTDYLYMKLGVNDGIRVYGISPNSSSSTSGLSVFHVGDDLDEYVTGGQALAFRFGNWTNTSLTSDIGSSAGNFFDAMAMRTTATGTITTIYNAFNLNYITSAGFLKSDASGNVTVDTNTYALASAVAGFVSGSGSINKLPKWSATQTLTDSNIGDSGTVVTIGVDTNGTTFYGTNFRVSGLTSDVVNGATTLGIGYSNIAASSGYMVQLSGAYGLMLVTGGVTRINIPYNGGVTVSTLLSATAGLTVTGGKTTVAASAAGYASLNIPNGVAVTSPTTGDIYATTDEIRYNNGSLLGIDPYVVVNAVSTANIATLSGTTTIDGVALVAGNLVLLQNQTTQSQNGVYVVSASTWSRATSFSNETQLLLRDIYVSGGTANKGTWWMCGNKGNITVGTTPIVITRIPDGISYGAGYAISSTSLSASAPLTYNNTNGVFAITQATTSTNGYLSSTDWNTFNNKQSALTNPITASATGTANFIPKFTAGTTIANSSMLDSNSGRLEFSSTWATADTTTKGIVLREGYQITLGHNTAETYVFLDQVRSDNSQRNNIITITNSAGFIPTLNIASAMTGTSGVFSSTLTSTKFITSGGTSTQFVMGDGSLNSAVYLTTTVAASTYQPLDTNLTALSTGKTNNLFVFNGIITAGNYFGNTSIGDTIIRWGAPYTEKVHLGVMSSAAGTNNSSLWFTASSAGTSYSFTAASLTITSGGIKLYPTGGSVTFANGTWNTVGDDVQFGDINEAGVLGFRQSASTQASFIRFGATGPGAGGYKFGFDGTNLTAQGPLSVTGTFYAGLFQAMNYLGNTASDWTWFGYTGIHTSSSRYAGFMASKVGDVIASARYGAYGNLNAENSSNITESVARWNINGITVYKNLTVNGELNVVEINGINTAITGDTHGGQWFSVGTLTIGGQYGSSMMNFEVSNGYGTGIAGNKYNFKGNIKIKQQNLMTGTLDQCYITIDYINGNYSSSNIMAVLTTDTSSSKVVTLYFYMPWRYDNIKLLITNTDSSYVNTLVFAGETLPVGTTYTVSSGMLIPGTLSTSGDTTVGGNVNSSWGIYSSTRATLRVGDQQYGMSASGEATYLWAVGSFIFNSPIFGTGKNMGSSTNWWGSGYFTTLYESNVPLSDKYHPKISGGTSSSFLRGDNTWSNAINNPFYSIGVANPGIQFFQGGGYTEWALRQLAAGDDSCVISSFASGSYTKDYLRIDRRNSFITLNENTKVQGAFEITENNAYYIPSIDNNAMSGTSTAYKKLATLTLGNGHGCISGKFNVYERYGSGGVYGHGEYAYTVNKTDGNGSINLYCIANTGTMSKNNVYVIITPGSTQNATVYEIWYAKASAGQTLITYQFHDTSSRGITLTIAPQYGFTTTAPTGTVAYSSYASSYLPMSASFGGSDGYDFTIESGNNTGGIRLNLWDDADGSEYFRITNNTNELAKFSSNGSFYNRGRISTLSEIVISKGGSDTTGAGSYIQFDNATSSPTSAWILQHGGGNYLMLQWWNGSGWTWRGSIASKSSTHSQFDIGSAMIGTLGVNPNYARFGWNSDSTNFNPTSGTWGGFVQGSDGIVQFAGSNIYSNVGAYTWLEVRGNNDKKINGDLQVISSGTGWGEGIRVVTPLGSWGGYRLTQVNSIASNSGNWAMGYMGGESTGNYVFVGYSTLDATYPGNRDVLRINQDGNVLLGSFTKGSTKKGENNRLISGNFLTTKLNSNTYETIIVKPYGVSFSNSASYLNKGDDTVSVYDEYAAKNGDMMFVSDNMTVGGILNIEGSSAGLFDAGTSQVSAYMPKLRMFNHDTIWTDVADQTSCYYVSQSFSVFFGSKRDSSTTTLTGYNTNVIGKYDTNMYSTNGYLKIGCYSENNSAPIYIGGTSSANTNYTYNQSLIIQSTVYNNNANYITIGAGSSASTSVSINASNITLTPSNASTINNAVITQRVYNYSSTTALDLGTVNENTIVLNPTGALTIRGMAQVVGKEITVINISGYTVTWTPYSSSPTTFYINGAASSYPSGVTITSRQCIKIWYAQAAFHILKF